MTTGACLARLTIDVHRRGRFWCYLRGWWWCSCTCRWILCRFRDRTISFQKGWLEPVNANILMFTISIDGEKLVSAFQYWKWSIVRRLKGFFNRIMANKNVARCKQIRVHVRSRLLSACGGGVDLLHQLFKSVHVVGWINVGFRLRWYHKLRR